jgi:hypothetical protein
MPSFRHLPLAAQLTGCATPAPIAARPAGELPRAHRAEPTSAAISPADLMSRLYPFADDSMMGRESGTRGNVVDGVVLPQRGDKVPRRALGRQCVHLLDVDAVVGRGDDLRRLRGARERARRDDIERGQHSSQSACAPLHLRASRVRERTQRVILPRGGEVLALLGYGVPDHEQFHVESPALRRAAA